MIPIIIVNWNGLSDTIECIDSVLALEDVLFEVYLVDNNSDSVEREELKKMYGDHPSIHLVFNNTNKGFAKANIDIWETHLKDKHFEYLALLNNDTIVDKKWLVSLLNCSQQNNAEVISSKMINYFKRDKMDNAGHMMINTGEVVPIGHNDDETNYNTSFENFGACAGACLYSTSMINEIGFFDPHFSTGYEDAEFSIRAIVTNHKCYFEPKAIVYHKMGKSIKKIFDEDYSMMIHQSILFSYFKCMPLLNILVAIPSFLFKYLSMFLINIIFWRPKYLKIMWQTWAGVLENHGQWKEKRKQLNPKKKTFIWHKKFINFFWFDVKRFWRIIVLRKNSAIDSYGN